MGVTFWRGGSPNRPVAIDLPSTVMTSTAPLTYSRWMALALARAFQTDDDAPGGRRAQALLGRGMACVGEEHRRWLLPLCQHLAGLSAPVWHGMTPRTLAEHLEQRPEFLDAFDPEGPRLHVRRLLLRLDGLAARFGARYSRYADDLVFSGASTPSFDAVTLHAWVKAIVEGEGFRLRSDKTRLMRAGGRQTVTGLVVNETPHIARPDYDRLRAEMHRLGRQPAVDLSLRAPLMGRLAWARQFVAPSRAAKLQRLFDAISFVQ